MDTCQASCHLLTLFWGKFPLALADCRSLSGKWPLALTDALCRASCHLLAHLLGKLPLALADWRSSSGKLPLALTGALCRASCHLPLLTAALRLPLAATGDAWASPGALRLPPPPVDAFGVLGKSFFL